LTDFKKYARLQLIRQRLSRNKNHRAPQIKDEENKKQTSLRSFEIGKENTKDAGHRWKQRCQDVLYRYAAKDGGVFPQRFEFPGLGDEKQAGADI
jgi:hypothetical protein